jgi:hypothetical protein
LIVLQRTGSNGSISVSLHTKRDVKQICGHNASRMVSPITVAVVAEDGRGRSAKIEIVAARGVMLDLRSLVERADA